MDKNINILDFGENDKQLEKQYLDMSADINDENLSLPWIEKYRPNTFEDIVYHTDILNALTKMIENKGLSHLMFYGPPGIGKTTTILSCAKKMYGANYKNMILELNGSEDRGINVVRDQIKDFSVSKQFIGNFTDNLKHHIKLVILDEADSMTSDAQFALRRVIENYTANTRFCIICNYDTKIINALKSRCMIFRFTPIPINLHLDRINQICKNENIFIDDKAIKTIVKLADGDMRKSINLLQAVHTSFKFANKYITKNDIYKQIGYPTEEEIAIICDILIDNNINLSDAIQRIALFKLQFGTTTNDILKHITEFLLNKITTENTQNIAKILDILGNLENNMTISHNDNLMLANIVSCVKILLN